MTWWFKALAVALVFVPGLTMADDAPQNEAASKCGSPAKLQDGWSVGAPEQYGVDPAPLCAMGERVAGSKLANVHAIVVVRHGVLVYERYFAGKDQRDLEPPAQVTFDATTLHNVNSATKSVTSLLVGIAVDRGWIKDLDASVLSFFPEFPDLGKPEKSRITLRHLLTMSDGLDWHEFTPPFDSFSQLFKVADPYRYILEREVVAPPGGSFNYNSGATELLGEVLHRATGRPLDVLVKEELLDRLGIDDVEWRRLQNGNVMASAGLRLRPRDMAKIGQIVLNHGAWQGRQIVPAAWIAQSIAPQNNGPSVYFYGFQWWLGRSFIDGREIDWAGAFGWGGQRLIVVPELDLVVFVTAWLPRDMALPEYLLLNQYILPAVAAASGQ